MKLLDTLLRPRTGTIPVVCGEPCASFDDDIHLEFHLREDFAKVIAKANEHGVTIWMRCAIFEEQIGDALVNALKACARDTSRAKLKGPGQAATAVGVVRTLVEKSRGVHLQDVRDISTTVEVGPHRHHTTYVIYELRVDSGSSLPSMPA